MLSEQIWNGIGRLCTGKFSQIERCGLTERFDVFEEGVAAGESDRLARHIAALRGRGTMGMARAEKAG